MSENAAQEKFGNWLQPASPGLFGLSLGGVVISPPVWSSDCWPDAGGPVPSGAGRSSDHGTDCPAGPGEVRRPHSPRQGN